MTMIAIKEAARTAYQNVADSRRRLREQEASENKSLSEEAYRLELETLQLLLHKHLGLEEDAYEVYPEGRGYPGFVPPKPVAKIEGLLFFVGEDGESGVPVLMLSFDDDKRFSVQAEVYSLADIGEAIEKYSAAVAG